MLEIYEQLTQEEQEKLQDVIRQLYRQTFLLERKYDKKAGRMIANKDFYFCDKHMEFLTAYFAVAGVPEYGAGNHLAAGGGYHGRTAAQACNHLSAFAEADL